VKRNHTVKRATRLSAAVIAAFLTTGCGAADSDSVLPAANDIVLPTPRADVDAGPVPDVALPPPDTCEDGVSTDGNCVPTGTSADNITLVGSFDGDSFVEILDVEYRSGLVFMCTGTKGLAIYDSPDGSPPRHIVHKGRLGQGSHSSFPRCQHVEFGGEVVDPKTETVDVFVTNRGDETQTTPWIKWIRIVGGTNTISPSLNSFDHPIVATLPGDAEKRSFEGLVYREGLIYAAVHTGGLVVIDTANDELNVVGAVDVGGNAFDVGFTDAGTLVVATSDAGIRTFDVTNPLEPKLLGVAAVPGSPRRLAIRGEMIFGAAGASGLQVVDASDPAAPTLVGALDLPGSAMDVHVDGNYAVVAAWEDFRVINIEDPKAPWLAGVQIATGQSSFTRVLTADLRSDANSTNVFIGEWTALQTYVFDPAATPPEVRLDQTELIFEPDTASRAVIVRNEGWLPLTVAASISTAGYEVSPTEVTTAPQDAAVLEVIAAAPIAAAQLILALNDPDELQLSVPIRVAGSGFGIGPGDQAPKDTQLLDLETGNVLTLGEVTAGKVAVLAYFSTF
jgi:phage tail protein X